MLTGIIQDLFAYTRWANTRVLDAAAALSPEQLTRDMGSSFPSIHATLVHMLSAEWIWLSRWQGISPPGPPPEWRLETVADLHERWTAIEDEREAFLLGLDDATLGRTVEYRTMRGDPSEGLLYELLLHAVNHSTYHRGQVVTMLRQVGAPGVSTDLVLYHRERAKAV